MDIYLIINNNNNNHTRIHNSKTTCNYATSTHDFNNSLVIDDELANFPSLQFSLPQEPIEA